MCNGWENKRSMHYEKYYGMTAYENLKKAKDQYGEQILFSYMENGRVECVTYNKFWEDVLHVAYRFDERQLKGKYIVIEGKSNYEIIVAFYATVSIGAIAAVLNLDLPEQEILEAMDVMKPAMMICSEDNLGIVEQYSQEHKICCMYASGAGHETSIRQWIHKGGTLYEYKGDQKPSDPAIVLMTSGSTSKSKLVLLSHYVFMPDKETSTDKAILVFPLYHVAGIAVVSNCITRGTNLCLSNMKDGIRDMDWFRPAAITAVPAFISVLIKKSKQKLFDLTGIKYITSAGAPQNLEEAKYLKSLGVFTSSTYGATEISGSAIYATPSEHRFGAVGKPGPWNKVKISEFGEILIKGNNLMIEYIGSPKETQEVIVDGWYHTGDVGYIDSEGFLYVTGRIKNIIILSNGENVSPEAIESQLINCPEIEEVVVYGENDSIIAHVWCGGTRDDEIQEKVEEYIAKYNQSVPTYRRIRRTIFREVPFDKTPSGKIKRELI